jgi:hypothetical protein
MRPRLAQQVELNRSAVQDLSTEGWRTHSVGLALIAAVPHKIHTILTDNGIQFRYAPCYAAGPRARSMTHMFAMRCRENDIEHRFTKINHARTNGQVERMN